MSAGEPFYMIELSPNPGALIRYAQAHGFNRRADEDLGYAVHAWLADFFGNAAPKPFRLLYDRGQKRPARVFAYSNFCGSELAERAASFASPLAAQVCDCRNPLPDKPMPSHWRNSRQLGFEVLACPVARQGNQEKDVFLRRVEQRLPDDPPPSREQAYRAWLEKQLGLAASLDDFSLQGLQLVRVLRRRQPQGDSRERTAPFLQRPQALMRGVLTVRDGAAFEALLRRGIGRHRAFGYGMLLLRPAS